MTAIKQASYCRFSKYLQIRDQRRQIIFNKGAQDLFMVNLAIGARSLDQALATCLAASDKYDLVIKLDRTSGTLEGPTPISFDASEKAQALLNELLAPQLSEVPPDVDGDNPEAGAWETVNSAETEEEMAEPSAAQRDMVANIRQQCSGQSEAALMARLTEGFKQHPDKKFAVVYLYPDSMVIIDNQQNFMSHESELRNLTEWAQSRNVDSFLILDEHRQGEFNAWQDRVLNNDEYAQMVDLPRPSKDELAAFLKRAICRRDLACADPETIAATAAAQDDGLRNFATRLHSFIVDSPRNKLLDDFYSDKDKVQSRAAIMNKINSLIGLEEVKGYAVDLCEKIDAFERLAKAGKSKKTINLPHFLFLGNPGTGKTIVARLLGQLFLALGLRSRNVFVEIALRDLVGDSSKRPEEAMAKKIEEAMGGVLFIDEVYQLAEDRGGQQALQVLLKEMEDKRDSFTVIMAGYAEKKRELFNVNPGFKERIGETFTFRDYNVEELTQIVESELKNEHLAPNPAAITAIKEYIESRQQRGGFGNGRGARKLVEKIKSKANKRNPDANDVWKGDVPPPLHLLEKEARAWIDEFDKTIGLVRVKEFLERMYTKQLGVERRRQGSHEKGEKADADKPKPNNCIFRGNPGTGKTTVAKKMGMLFYYLGMVSEEDHTIVIGLEDIISAFVGEFAQRLQDAFEEAVGGVLFIDEAYQLAKDQQGRQALDQIVKMTTDPRYSDMVVILAGYSDEMHKLAECNPGIARRFPNLVDFDDYTPEELSQIFMGEMAKKNLEIDPQKRQSFELRLRNILARMAAERHFGNAGAVITFFEDVVLGNQAKRLQDKDSKDPAWKIISEDDLRSGSEDPKGQYSDILKEMDEKLVGLPSVKKFLRSLDVKWQRASHLGVPIMPTKFSVCFAGQPGTGKQTVVAYYAQILCALGFISQKKPRVYSAVNLKGQYLGQTKEKVNDMFVNSAGSVMVIQNIYALGSDDYAQEAIAALAGGLSDPKNSCTVVVLTGDEDRMTSFFTNFPHLGQYFGTTLIFPGYKPEECLEMLYLRLKAEQYEIKQDDRESFKEGALSLFMSQTENGALSAFAVERVFDTIKGRHLQRMQELLAHGHQPSEAEWKLIHVGKDLPKDDHSEQQA